MILLKILIHKLFFITRSQPCFLMVCIVSMIFCISCKTRKVLSPMEPNKTALAINCTDSNFSADSSIMLSPKKIVSLFGLKKYTAKGTVFSSLKVGECNKDKFFKLSSFGTFSPLVTKDTLFLKQLVNLPVASNFGYEEHGVLQHKLWFSHDTLQLKVTINEDFKAYSPNQVLDVFEEYQAIEVQYNEKTELLMDKLFVSALSGNLLAVKTFKNFEAKFKDLNEKYKVKYVELSALLKQYLEAK